MTPAAQITLIITGGTLDTVGEGRLDLFDYARHGRWLTPAQLLDSIPELATLATIKVEELPRFGVTSAGIDDWVQIHEAIARAIKDGSSGIVVTQGSNYLEENAYFASLTYKSDVPLVFTAAMRPASGMISDGAMNLVDSVRVASCPETAQHGAVVVMNGEIHAARDVVKTHTHALEAFRSPLAGSLGTIRPDGRVHYHARRPERPILFECPGAGFQWSRVDIIQSCYGSDGALVDAAVGLGAAGLVSAGFGAGRPGPGFSEAFARAAASGIPVVLSARGTGRALASPAELARNYIGADDLPPWKARILLLLSLTRTRDARVIQDYFNTF